MGGTYVPLICSNFGFWVKNDFVSRVYVDTEVETGGDLKVDTEVVSAHLRKYFYSIILGGMMPGVHVNAKPAVCPLDLTNLYLS